MKKTLKLFQTIFPLLISASVFGQAQNSASSLSMYIDSFAFSKIDSAYKKSKVPGIFVGVLQKGKREYYSVGFADKALKTPFNSSMIFEAGSITKTFTAYITEVVLKEHHIAETASIIDFLPDSVKTNKKLQAITFYQLLNHTSGLPRLPDNLDATVKDQMQPYENYTTNDLFSYLKNCVPKPDSKSNYSNLGFGLLGVLDQIISKKTYDELLNEKIFKHFMASSKKKAADENKKIQGYFDTSAVAFWKWDALSGCGKLTCSAAEMLDYLQYMSKPDDANSIAIIDTLTAPTVAINNRVKVCRAWNTVEEKDKPVIYWHNGGTFGFSTFAAFLKEKNTGVIVVINAFDKNGVSDGLGIEIMNELMHEL